jgi:hypothetical protein
MKRGKLVAGIFIVIILLQAFIISGLEESKNQINTSKENSSEEKPKLPDLTIPEKEDVKKDLKGATETVRTSTNEIVEKEIEVPESLKVPARIIFGLKPGDKLDISILITMICLWIFLVLLLSKTLELTPFFENGKSWLGAILITGIIGVSGSIKSVTVLWLDLGNIFGVLEKWGAFKLGFVIIFLFSIFFGLNYVLKILKDKKIIEESMGKGTEAGLGMAQLSAMQKTQRDFSGL